MNPNQTAGKSGWTPERRAAQAERAKQIASKRKQSPSVQSNALESSSVVSLPPASQTTPTNQTTQASQTSQRNDPLAGVLEKLEALAKRDDAKKQEPKKRLPVDPDQRRNALSVYQIPARGPVMGLQALFQFLEWDAMSDMEYEANVEAWAALLWYYGLDHPVIGVALVTMGTCAPRVTKAMVNSKRRKQGLQALPQRKEGTVIALEPEPK